MLATESGPFEIKQRIQLFYLTMDLLPPPTGSLYDTEGGEEFYKFDELLRKVLGFLPTPDGVEERIKKFILSATEDQLMTMIQLIPVAQVAVIEQQNQCLSVYRSFHFEDRTDKVLEDTCSRINNFLEHIGSPARFLPDGSFSCEGGVILALPAPSGAPPRRQPHFTPMHAIDTEFARNLPVTRLDVPPEAYVSQRGRKKQEER